MAKAENMIAVCMIGIYPPPIGGVATHCYKLTQALCKQNIRIVFFDTFKHHQKRIPADVKYVMIDYGLWKQNLFYVIIDGFSLLIKSILLAIRFLPCFTCKEFIKFFVIIISLFSLSRHSRLKIIHTHHAYPSTLAAKIIADHYKIPYVLTIHGSELVNKNLKKLAKFVIQNAARVISVSAHTKNLAQRNQINKEIRVIPNGVDFAESADSTFLVRSKYFLEGKQVVLFVGWFIERKGPHVLIKAIPFIQNNDVVVLFIGPDMGYKQEMQQMIIENKLEKKAVIIGEISDNELHQLYKTADLLVLPSITENEGFGIVLLEAMANGIPVIGSNIGGIPEVIIDGKTGFLFQLSDHIDLAGKISTLLNDRSLRQKMGQRGKELVQTKFSWAKIATQVKEVYKGLV